MKKDIYFLTAPQNSIWLTEQFYQGTNINNICGSMTISEKVNFEKLAQAINIFVENTDSFRIKLFMDNTDVKQYISDYTSFNVEIINVFSDEDVKNIENEIANIPFDLMEKLLFNFKLFRFPDGHGGFVINAHHIISDSWTLGIVVNKIINIYSCLLNNENIDTSNDFSYIDYIHSEQDYLKSDKYIKDKEYWNNIYSTVPEIATIPSTNLENSKNISIRANRELLNITNEQLININKFCTQNKVSIYNFFMAVFAIYLSRVSNLDDFVIGTPILNRTNFKEKHTAGMFINTIPFRISINHEETFKEFVSTISLNSMGMLRHQKYSYQYILENLRKQDSSLPNLYKVMLSYQVTKMTDNNESIPHSSSWTFNQTTADDLDIHLYDFNDSSSLNIAYDYNIEKYSKEDIIATHKRILHIINQIIDNNDLPLKNIEIVTPEEKHQILFDFNNTTVDYPKDKTVVQLFEEQVEKNPDNIAVVFEDQQLTYRELNEKANQLAHYLQDIGVKSGEIIGIMVNRSLEMIVGILSILKCGGAYLPIDPDYPDDRISYMLEDSGCNILLTQKKLDAKFNYLIQIINIDLNNSTIYSVNKQNLNISIKSENLAYIIYTSGSTGKPKGVMLKHKSLSNLINYCNSYVDYLKDNIYRTIVSVTTISFDIFIFETLISLQKGLKLIIANQNEQTIPRLLNTLIEKENIEIIQTTPSRMQLLLNNILDIPNINKLKYITLAGEQLPIGLVKKLINITNGKIYNGYGPSETTVFSTLTEVSNYNKITIGKPLNNTQIYILNNNHQLCPIGISGEIYIAGDGVGKGYINRPNLNLEKYIVNPFIPNSIMYKTGDLGFFTLNGEIVCLGRCDNQIKIRGLRIELDEIENILSKFNCITNCIVSKKVDKNSREFLCAYYTKNGNIDITDLRNYLQKKLPKYMVPQYFVELDSLPYTPNGKIDKKALPMPNIDTTYNINISPRNNIDIILTNILKELLKINNISITNSFFDLGGDSLTAINLCMHIYTQLNVQLSVKDILNTPIISELSDLITSKTDKDNIEIITKAENKNYYPASSAQKRMYYSSNLDGENSLLYNIAGGIILDKIPNITKLEECFKTIIDRHESLRTYFDIVDGDIVQKILPNIDFKLEVENSDSNNIKELFNKFITPFNLNKAPLFKAKLINLNNNKSFLILNMHHIISDGTSLSILINELCSLYNNFGELPKLSIDYKDFAVWENNKLNKNEFKESETFWVNQFNDEIPLLNMPTTYPRPPVQSFEGDSIYTKFNIELTEKLNNLSKQLGITPYMLLLSIYYILLYKYTGQTDIIVGSPIVGRDNIQLTNIIGMFVNSLALRNKIDSSLTFAQFANIIKENCLKAFEHQTYPFDELISKLDLQRDTSRNPLFDTMFIYQNSGNSSINFDGIKAENYIPENNISKFDLSLEIIPENQDLNLRFEYCTKLFSKEFITKLSEHYTNILKVILENKNIRIADIDMLSEEEKNQILFDFNNTTVDYPKDKTVVQLFEGQVEKNPDNIAVVFEDKKLTYRELNEKANQLAHYLQTTNIQPNNIVGIMLERSLETIICMLAVLKTNCAYMLINPTLPDDRIIYMLNNANSPLLITSSNIRNINFDNKIIIDNENLNNYGKNNLDLNYNINNNLSVVYTSGSTGLPKGVLLKQQGMINLIFSYRKFVDIDNISKFLSICSISFDMFAVEIFISLSNGKTLYLANSEENKNPISISNLIKNNNIEFLMCTPSKMELLLANSTTIDCLKYLKTIQLGGEILTPNLYNYLKKYTNAQICNQYGPSEITSYCSYKEITSDKNINIGKPINNTNIFILNTDLNICPINVSGEICVTGDGISKGYINNPTATQKSFIPNPFSKGLLYKTGDIGKYNSNGEIEFIGRKDFQVKLRGLRIELSEIEKQFLNIPHIKNCAIIYKEEPENNSYLAGFFTSNRTMDISFIRAELAKHLPLYMVPKYIIQLDNMPITRNGKIDLKALKKYEISATETDNYVAPENELQKLFCTTWEKLLNTRVGINNDIFELGADSLLAIKFKVEMLANNIDVQYADIFKYPTVKSLSEANKITIQKQIDNFDYTEINSVLEKNNIKNCKNIIKNTNNNVLLLGSNGFVGMHILYNFIKKDTGNIYCIVRDKNKLSAQTRFLNTLHFYFDTELDEFINNRIIILKGDITKENFGLEKDLYNNIINNVSIIINSSANVKHYGDFKNFENINIGLTKKAIEFCEKYNKRLIQISSTSVCGNIREEKNITFSEQNLYIGQELDNVYIKSKFEAEKLILEHINAGLNAQILRLGNITNRYSDGKFQINPEENAFIGRLQSFIKLGIIPDYLLNTKLEFTPVDLCGSAIISIMQNYVQDFSVFHLYNNNFISMGTLINLLKPHNIKLNIVTQDEFNKIVKETLLDDKKKDILSGIINELSANNTLEINSNIDIMSEFSRIFLNTLDFNWLKIDNIYIKKYIDYMKNIKFI